MPKIKRTAYTKEFSEHAERSAAFKENRDCSVKALAIACNVTYEEARLALQAVGRKNRRGVWNNEIKPAIEMLGCDFRVWMFKERQDIIASYPGVHSRLHSITTHHPRRFAKQWEPYRNRTLLLFSSGHVSAFKNGQVHDWAINRAKRVTEIWEIF